MADGRKNGTRTPLPLLLSPHLHSPTGARARPVADGRNFCTRTHFPHLLPPRFLGKRVGGRVRARVAQTPSQARCRSRFLWRANDGRARGPLPSGGSPQGVGACCARARLDRGAELRKAPACSCLVRMARPQFRARGLSRASRTQVQARRGLILRVRTRAPRRPPLRHAPRGLRARLASNGKQGPRRQREQARAGRTQPGGGRGC
mmetsp:Transcript_42696/g.100216  ORF Transcript_42696/g.100216 Transcript_42696/m.100216 type:complete len:205 (+) Transcript_42696:928-1542(+)